MRTALLLLLLTMGPLCGARTTTYLRDGWQFSRDGSASTAVSVPHDWAIAGPFDKRHDLQTVAIEQNGETAASEKSGRSGALPWMGHGTYRCEFVVPDSSGWTALLFDGAMSHPRVTVNGRDAGGWAYGYNAFQLDVTALARPGLNTLQVDLDNQPESSRWYPGAGLYRPVQLITGHRIHLDDWETFARTARLSDAEATLTLSAKVAGLTPDDDFPTLRVQLLDATGATVIDQEPDLDDNGNLFAQLKVPNPHPWTPETPYLYTLRLTLANDEGELDQSQITVGLRTVRVSPERGFELNGKSRKFQGVCLHHDLGPLGAAINRDALARQLTTMKRMGADAIRTAHNMPSEWQMQLCDSLGLMVMAESFDMWVYPKCKNGYATLYKEWWERDLRNLVRRHRNHPSVVMWSIGNEIPEQGMGDGASMLVAMQDCVHKLDESRPVTQGMDRIEAALSSGFAQRQDVVGMNYRVHLYQRAIGRLPQGRILASETASTVSSRGIYKLPMQPAADRQHGDGQCSSYDVEYCSWSNLPDDDFAAQRDLPYLMGQFVWTGYDYLGEPSPYDSYWPARSSYFGLCDLAGLPKDRYYLYKSQWDRTEHTAHLLPHWTWPGREGRTIPVVCYTDCPQAELFVNGKSQGVRRHTATLRVPDHAGSSYTPSSADFRLTWPDVTYEAGELTVVCRDSLGHEVCRDRRRTAAEARHVRLQPDRPAIAADPDALCFVTVSLTDKAGTELPTATDMMRFEVTGGGAFEAVCNGDPTSLLSFKLPNMPLFAGELVVIVRADRSDKPITLRAVDESNKLQASIDIPKVK